VVISDARYVKQVGIGDVICRILFLPVTKVWLTLSSLTCLTNGRQL